MTSLADIQFPVYLIGTEKPQEEDGVIFYHRIDKDGKEHRLIVDNKNWHHETISQRRLKCLMLPEVKLAKLTHAIFFLADLIKLSGPKVWFIDNYGKLFIYNKSYKAQLVIKPISRIIPNYGTTIIEVDGIETRFKCLYAPKQEKYAGLLKIGHGYILYGLYSEKPKDTWRMV